MIHYSPLHWSHLVEAAKLGWGGWEKWTPARLRFMPMVGYVAHNDAGDLIGFGGVVWIGAKAIGCLHLTPAFLTDPRSRWVHRQALEVISLAHRVSPVIEAIADPKIPRSREFMRRLGFEPGNGETWFHGAGDPGGSGSSRVVRHGERADDCVTGGGGCHSS
jgi:hypothetical protein